MESPEIRIPDWMRVLPGAGRMTPDGSARSGRFGDRIPSENAAFKILVVEDERETLEAVTELLEAESLSVLRARHGQEALDLLHRGERPSLILLDLKMPVMDGWEFCRRVAADAELAQIPIAVVTASASVNAPPRLRDAGLFVKPVDYDRLLAMVKGLRR